MLSFFRQRGLSSILYGLIIVATILTFVIEFRPSAGKRTASLTEQCAAHVRGRCLEPKDFTSAYRMLMPSRSAQQSRRLNLKRVAMDGLIERELLADEAKRLGISVSDDEVTDQLYDGFVRFSVPAADPTVQQTILQEMYQSYARAGLVSQEVAMAHLTSRDAAIPVGFDDPKSKHFDIKVYERKVRNMTNLSTAEFREAQARELLAAKLRDVVRAPVRVSEAEVWQGYDRQYSTATVASVPVKESWAAHWAVDGTQADAATWVKTNQQTYDTTLQGRLNEDAPKAGHIRHILVKLAYGATPDEKAAALAKLSWAASRIRAGEPFAEVARDVSDDSGSALSGGDAGDKTDSFVSPFRIAANALRPGEVTAGAVATQFGYHLIMKDDPARAAEVEAAVKESLPRDLMIKARATDAAKNIAQTIAAALRSGKTVDQAIADSIAPLHRNEKTELLRILPPPAGSGGDAGASDVPPPPGDLPKVSFDALTDPDRPQAQISNAFNRGGDPFAGLSPDGTAAVIGFAFRSNTGDAMAEPVRTTEGFVAVQLKDHRSATRAEFDKNRGAFQQDMVQTKRDEALALYVKRLREKAKDGIKIDSTYIEESKPGSNNEEDEDDL
jgi:peptidyl-prolyl cis-trans isomerase D